MKDMFCLFKQKTAYEMRISDWSSDVCSSDLAGVEKLREWLAAHPGARMVVSDTLASFRDPDPGRKSAYMADYAVGEMLKPLTREFPIAIDRKSTRLNSSH